MKVLFVSSGNSLFGIVPFIKMQGESLIDKGVNLEFFTIKGKGLIGYLSNVSKLRRKIKVTHFDIIHAHFVFSGLATLLTFTRKPIILSLMGDDAFGSYNEQGKRKLKGYLGMLTTQLIQPFVNCIIVKSKNIYKYTYQKEKVRIIPNGVNFKIFRPLDKYKCRRKLRLDPSIKIILTLANPSIPRKNFILLEKAKSFIKSKDVIIINPYPIEHKLVPLYLNSCDVFLLTSFNEGSPNVIKEAMACNTPIVSTNVGDVKEVINGTKGCYITTFIPKDVAKKIDMALRFENKTNGRENIKHLSSDFIANRILLIYKKHLRNKCVA